MLRDSAPTSSDRPAGGPATAHARSRDADPVVDALERVAVALRDLRQTPDTDDARVALGQLRAVHGVETALAAVKLRAIATAERLRAYRAEGANTLQSWLQTALASSSSQASKDATTAGMLGSLPATADALARGRIGPDHAATIARTARRGRLGDDPAEVEGQLLGLARTRTPDEFARLVRRRETAADAEAVRKDAQRQHALRHASFTERPDGMWDLRAVCDQAGAEIVGTALSAFTRPDPADTPDEHRRDHGKRLFDGLVDAFQAALDSGAASDIGGEKPHVGIVVKAETLLDPDDTTPGEADVTGPCSADMARRVACDARLYRIVLGAKSEPLDIGRTSREWTLAQRRAITLRDGHCRGPSCDRPAAWCSIHHVKWWTRDLGPTAIDNGLLLCHHCHKKVHDLNWQLAFDATTGEATWTSPTGRLRVRTRPKVHQPRIAVA